MATSHLQLPARKSRHHHHRKQDQGGDEKASGHRVLNVVHSNDNTRHKPVPEEHQNLK